MFELLEYDSLKPRQKSVYYNDVCNAHDVYTAWKCLFHIGRTRAILWPARSPDLITMDIHLWGQMKNLVYEVVSVSNVEKLRQRIMITTENTSVLMKSKLRKKCVFVWERGVVAIFCINYNIKKKCLLKFFLNIFWTMLNIVSYIFSVNAVFFCSLWCCILSFLSGQCTCLLRFFGNNNGNSPDVFTFHFKLLPISNNDEVRW